MYNIKRQLGIVVEKSDEVNTIQKKSKLRVPQAPLGYAEARREVLYGGVVCVPRGAFGDAFDMAIATVEACGGKDGRGSDGARGCSA
ncbi:uncharacterized protein MONOS_16084 [Monocercomonoides exilis]|uniref:uncharacterized protein n=1 Tax=Monocercomonoides exilis TaxID=2049356 RepID=UPI003559ED63|nr:hypothetical protein MONOS_16084 [Monocercomonoides exilis]|eukprot:MONOS_16084.1-p1 / transcript=MONOS_16084.1 / gene=MONOS_16084 / organism=Monocercomonoides_exilis_PA203 / gene_product=unspecified product / transcript_product=unspecified product / location=Mono_scaffold01497:3803-4196(-) / protein_length=87 / sequence_SO=supercontig / SO=protein_coding / is_pseudo=false